MTVSEQCPTNIGAEELDALIKRVNALEGFFVYCVVPTTLLLFVLVGWLLIGLSGVFLPITTQSLFETAVYKAIYKERKRAAENDNGQAQCEVGEFYQFGIGVRRDWVQALHWFSKAIQNGYERSGQSNMNCLQRLISANQTRFNTCVEESLNKTCYSSAASQSLSLGVWAHGLERLAVRDHQPVGFTPTFVAMKGLVPHVFKDFGLKTKQT